MAKPLSVRTRPASCGCARHALHLASQSHPHPLRLRRTAGSAQGGSNVQRLQLRRQGPNSTRSEFHMSFRSQKLVKPLRRKFADFVMHRSNFFFLALERFWKMSVNRKLPSLSQPCTVILHSASRGLMSLNTHIAGNDAQWIFQFMITPPSLVDGERVAI